MDGLGGRAIEAEPVAEILQEGCMAADLVYLSAADGLPQRIPADMSSMMQMANRVITKLM